MIIGDSYHRGDVIDCSKFAADPGLPKEEPLFEVEASNKMDKAKAFRCKKCRRVVALQENIVDHVPGEGESSFEWHKRRSGNPFNKYDEIDCSSIFVEPLRWMTTGTKNIIIFLYWLFYHWLIGMSTGRVWLNLNPDCLTIYPTQPEAVLLWNDWTHPLLGLVSLKTWWVGPF